MNTSLLEVPDVAGLGATLAVIIVFDVRATVAAFEAVVGSDSLCGGSAGVVTLGFCDVLIFDGAAGEGGKVAAR